MAPRQAVVTSSDNKLAGHVLVILQLVDLLFWGEFTTSEERYVLTAGETESLNRWGFTTIDMRAQMSSKASVMLKENGTDI
ncbi:hypothetical protein TNCV_4605041 [Trichonephila clavipes]|nr:hypothetical protein TNCV_4605041 [Trichonephila clavipes]